MSISIMSAVWKNGPPNSTERFVLLALADYANDAGQGINPAFATIAKKCAISRRTAIRAVDSLIEQGYLARSLRMKDKEFTSSEYTIIIAKLGIGDDSKVTMRSDRKSPPSDNTSLRIVTMTLPSDTETLGSVVDDTTPSDTVSPNPSFLSINEPSLNRVRGESGATAPDHPPATSPHFQPVPEASRKRKKIDDILAPSPLPAIVQEAPRAMTLMQSVTGHWPGDNNREFLVESLGNEPDENALRAAFKLWNSSGYKPTNYRGICQWYQEILRDPAWTPEAQYKGRSNGNGHKSAPVLSNSERAAVEYAAKKRAILGGQ
jgi:hypothetical protein